MYSLHLSAEQLEFRDTVRGFVDGRSQAGGAQGRPARRRRPPLPMAVLDKASQMGLRTLALSEELGGVGADALTCCIVTEELAAGDAGIAAVLAETSALGGALFAAMTRAQRDKFLPAFVADDRYHLALADREPDTDTALGINYHRPGRQAPGADQGRAQRRRIHRQRRQGCVANAPVAKLIAVEADTGTASRVLLDAGRRGGLTVTESAGPRWYHGSCGEVMLQNCAVPAANMLPEGAPLRGEAGRGAPLAQAVNLGHRPRRLRGCARLRTASRAGRPPDRRAPGDRRQARRGRDPARSGAQRDLAGGMGVRSPGRAGRPQPVRPAAHHHRAGDRGRSDLSRHQGCRGVLRRHGRDARHAAAEIHHRRPHLPLLRRRRGDAKLRIAEALAATGGRRCSPPNNQEGNPWTSH